MADKGLYLIDVTVKPCVHVKDVFDGSWANFSVGSAEADNSKVIYGFKVVGESRLVAVLDGGVESAVASLNAAYGNQINVKCIPLRTYEGFAKSVLGVEDETLTQPSSHKIDSDGLIFFLHFVVEYRGMTATELMGTWRREAEKALGLRSSGDLQLDLYKVVGQREVYCFVRVPDAEIMDDITFTLPLLREIGDQVHITAKVVKPLALA